MYIYLRVYIFNFDYPEREIILCRCYKIPVNAYNKTKIFIENTIASLQFFCFLFFVYV